MNSATRISISVNPDWRLGSCSLRISTGQKIPIIDHKGLVDPPRNPVGSFLQATGPGLVARMRRQAAAFNATMVSGAAVWVDVSHSPFTITLDEAEAQTTAEVKIDLKEIEDKHILH